MEVSASSALLVINQCMLEGGIGGISTIVLLKSHCLTWWWWNNSLGLYYQALASAPR